MESIMANESQAAIANAAATVAQSSSSSSSSPTAALFQKAHAKLVTLGRIDEQLNSILDQRRKLQDELREVQSHINDEFDRVIRDAQESTVPAAAARLVATQFVSDQAAKLRRNGVPKETLRLEVAEAG
jgi:predicted transcriptional regulator